MTSGYHQLNVDASSKKFTSFRTHHGQFRYRRCPFGLKQAPPWFQLQMAKVLSGLIGVCCAIYIDDIVIYGTDDTFAANLKLVLDRLAEHSIILKESKCRFAVREITYLGHTLDGTKVYIHDSKKEVFGKLQLPTNTTSLRSFIGLMNYYRTFIGNDYADIMVPLYAKLATYGKKTKCAIQLAGDEIAAFHAIKEAAIDSKSLFFLKSEGDVFLKTDASDLAFGGTLTQIQTDATGKQERDITFFSKTFSATQRKWSTSDKEMYAVYYGVRSLHQFLAGRRFTILSDHEALSYNRESDSSKINRWKMAISEYDYELKHIAGEDNVVADALSRCMVSDDNIAEDMETDKILSMAGMSSSDKPFMFVRSADVDLSTSAAQKAALMFYHGEQSGHYDFKSTLQRMVDNKHVWPGVKHDLKDFISHCGCQKWVSKPQSYHEAPKSISTNFPNTRWDIDFMSLEEDQAGHKCALVIIDSCDRFLLDIIPLKEMKFRDFSQSLNDIMCRFGKPKSILADGAGNFSSFDYNELLKVLNVNAIPTIPRNSQDNSIVERAIRTIKTQAAAIREERFHNNQSNTWREVLSIVLRNHNARVHSSTGFAPSTIRFGIVNTLADQIKEVSQTDMLKEVKSNVEKAKQQQLSRRLFQPDTNVLTIGSRFWLKNPDRKKTALDPFYLGPYTLVKQSEGQVILEDVQGKRRSCHISDIHPFKGDEKL